MTLVSWLSPGPVVSFGLEVLVRGSALLGVAFLATGLMRRASAATRYALWAVLLAGLLVLPLVSAWLPGWSMVSWSNSNRSPRPAFAEVSTGSSRVLGISDDGEQRSGPMSVAGPERITTHGYRGESGPPVESGIAFPKTLRIPGAFWLLIAWWSGVLLVLGSLLRDCIRVWRLTQRALPDDLGQATALARDVTRRLAVTRRIRVLFSEELAVPVNWGVWRPVVLLPFAAREWTEDRIRVVLLHELAHVKRWDYLTHLLTELACAVYWPHPLAWLAARRARAEQERACDDAVLKTGTRSREYAEHLLEIARDFIEAPASLNGALAMAQPSSLRQRVGAILRGDLNRAALEPHTWILAGSVAMVVSLPLGTVRLWRGDAERRLITILDDRDVTRRQRAAWSLGERRSGEAIPALTARLVDSDPVVRGTAAWALGEIGEPSVVLSLRTALHDQNAQVREMAVLGLAKIRDRRTICLVLDGLKDSVPGVRSVTTEALIHVGNRRAIPPLMRTALNDSDLHTRSMAMWALKALDQDSLLPVLVQSMNDTSADARRSTTFLMSELVDPRVVDLLVTRLRNDADDGVRHAAAEMLAKRQDERAVAGLMAGLHDRDAGVRGMAAWGLGQQGSPEAIDALLTTALRDPEHTVRLTAARALDRLNQRLRG